MRALFTALLCVVVLVPSSDGAIDSLVARWLTIAQNTVLSVGVEHQQAGRVYGIVASGGSVT